MRNAFLVAASIAAIALLSSCQSFIRAVKADYTVPVTEDAETVRIRSDKIIAAKEYLRKFNTTDKFDKRHEVILIDQKYFQIDGVLYTYKFANLMYHAPNLSLLGTDILTLPDTICGIQGYATPVRDPSVAVSFIFAKPLFGQKGYSSMDEATKINGVSFSSPRDDGGYIDDFGKWRKYTYQDYLEHVFSTRKQDVSKKMYQSVERMQTFTEHLTDLSKEKKEKGDYK